jgi:uncharacterized protein YbjT (DUF2867 family)
MKVEGTRVASEARPRILVTGASGYVGGRLLRELDARGHRLRALVRRPERGRGARPPRTEIVRGDLLDPDTLAPALRGIDTAFYLVHSMASQGSFIDEDRRAAGNFARAARAARVRRIVYLGGLGEQGPHLSPHLRSRHDVGDLLRGSGVPVVELRASIVVGAGSLSFEMIRALVDRLPVMVTPRWVHVTAQPIAIRDLIACLIGALEVDASTSPVFEIGGRDAMSYGDLMREYARQRGLRRWMIAVPVLTPRLSSLWLALVTPLYARVGRHLIDSIRHPTVVRGDAIREVFDIEPMGVREAIAEALVDTAAAVPRRRVDARSTRVRVSAERAFAPIRRIGGRTGWYGCNLLWRLRGVLDRLAGGPGMRRGRRHPEELRVGDQIDFWRVEAFEPDRLLRLEAEMKLPGRAFLEFRVETEADGARIQQTATFDASGLLGLVYWYSILPLHGLVFSRMLAGIADAAERAGSDV